MNIGQVIRSRVHRILNEMDNYIQSYNVEALKKDGVILEGKGDFLGLYENHKGNLRENVVVTTLGLYVFNQEWKFVQYEDIASVNVPLNEEKDKSAADQLLLHLSNGSQVEIPIKGGQGRMRDVWEFSRFLHRVIKDTQNRDRGNS